MRRSACRLITISLVHVVLFCQFLLDRPADADVMITFSNGDTFEGDGPGDSAGPFADPTSGIVFTVNTVAIGGGGTALNPNAGTLGVVAATGSNSSFDPFESWTFSLNTAFNLTGINLGLFTGTETATLESSAWANGTYDAPGSNVSFSANATSGTFTFTAASVSDIFATSDFTSSGFVSVGSGIELRFTYTGADTMVLESLTVAAVPEVTSFAFLAVGLVMIGVLRIRRAVVT